MKFFIASIIFMLYCSIGEAIAVIESGVLSREPKTVVNQGSRTLYVWFYPGERSQPFRLWKTVEVVPVTLDEKPSHEADFMMYRHPTKDYLLIKAQQENQWSFRGVFRKWTGSSSTSTFIDPFSPTYVGIETDASFSVYLKRKNVDYTLALLFIGGICLYLTAKNLSRSTFAFYGGVTAVGVVGSLLIVVFILYKFAPKRSMALSVLVGGWSFVAYVFYALWSNLFLVLTSYNRYVAIYFVSVALISFAAAYMYGPPKGNKTLNLIQWSLQIAGLSMIYAGCQIPAISITTIIVVVVASSLPRCVLVRLRWLRYRVFPPKRRFLSEGEYIDQGVRETRKALDDLRLYCRSPDCDSWRTMSRLQSPREFADFVSGQRSHISDDEILRYSNESEHDDDYDFDNSAPRDDDDDESGSEFTDDDRGNENGIGNKTTTPSLRYHHHRYTTRSNGRHIVTRSENGRFAGGTDRW